MAKGQGGGGEGRREGQGLAGAEVCSFTIWEGVPMRGEDHNGEVTDD